MCIKIQKSWFLLNNKIVIFDWNIYSMGAFILSAIFQGDLLCTFSHFFRHIYMKFPRGQFQCSMSMKDKYQPEKKNFYSQDLGLNTLFFYKNQEMSAEARMFLILIHIFWNSHPTPTPNTCLKCFTWPKLSFGKFSYSNFKFFLVFEKISDQIWASMFL